MATPRLPLSVRIAARSAARCRGRCMWNSMLSACRIRSRNCALRARLLSEMELLARRVGGGRWQTCAHIARGRSHTCVPVLLVLRALPLHGSCLRAAGVAPDASCYLAVASFAFGSRGAPLSFRRFSAEEAAPVWVFPAHWLCRQAALCGHLCVGGPVSVWPEQRRYSYFSNISGPSGSLRETRPTAAAGAVCTRMRICRVSTVSDVPIDPDVWWSVAVGFADVASTAVCRIALSTPMQTNVTATTHR